jgi:hypothetical protein
MKDLGILEKHKKTNTTYDNSLSHSHTGSNRPLNSSIVVLHAVIELLLRILLTILTLLVLV